MSNPGFAADAARSAYDLQESAPAFSQLYIRVNRFVAATARKEQRKSLRGLRGRCPCFFQAGQRSEDLPGSSVMVWAWHAPSLHATAFGTVTRAPHLLRWQVNGPQLTCQATVDTFHSMVKF